MAGWNSGDRFGRRDSLRAMARALLRSQLWAVPLLGTGARSFFSASSEASASAVHRCSARYIAEVAPAKWRGRLGGVVSVQRRLRILLAYLSNYIVEQCSLAAEWRGSWASRRFPPYFPLFLFGIPRSPAAVKKQRIAEAREVLRLTGRGKYEQELQEIIVSIDADHAAIASARWKYGWPVFTRLDAAWSASIETIIFLSSCSYFPLRQPEDLSCFRIFVS